MTKTLTGTTEIYGAINVLDTPSQYKTGARTGQDYYIGRWGARGFTCSKEFYDAFKAGTLEEVTLTETSYKRMDLVTNTEVAVDSAVLGGYRSKDQVVAGLQGDKLLVKARAELVAVERTAGKIAERSAYIEAGIAPEEMLELMKLA